MGYKVASPLVIVRDPSGRMHHFYQDAVLPDGLDPEHVKQLAADGMILEEKAAAKAEATPPEGDSSSSDESGQPAKSAKKGDWEAFARAQGATDADLEGKSKDDLIAAYAAAE